MLWKGRGKQSLIVFRRWSKIFAQLWPANQGKQLNVFGENFRTFSVELLCCTCTCVLQWRVVGGGNRSLYGLGGAPDDGGDAHLQRRQKHNTENGAGHHGAIRRGE